MVDLGIDPRERPAIQPKAVPPTEPEPDAFVQILFVVCYYVIGLALMCFWVVGIGLLIRDRNPSAAGIAVVATAVAVPMLTFTETMRVGLRMLCTIARRK